MNDEAAQSLSNNADDCQSDIVHAELLTSRVKLHDGVLIVDDNVPMHDTFMVKLSVSDAKCGYYSASL